MTLGELLQPNSIDVLVCIELSKLVEKFAFIIQSEQNVILNNCDRSHALTRILYGKSIALFVCLDLTLLVMQNSEKWRTVGSSL